jgi:hypothetical protein
MFCGGVGKGAVKRETSKGNKGQRSKGCSFHKTK